MFYHRRCNKCILEFTFILITHINLLVTRIKRSAFAFFSLMPNHTHIYGIESYSYKYCLHHGITIHPEHTLTLLRFYNPYQEQDFFCVRILDVPPCCLKNTFTGLDEEGFI